MNYAILLSGGSGSRIGSDIPKQYITTRGRMMIIHPLCTLLKCSMVDSVYIVAGDEWRDRLSNDIKKTGATADKLKDFVSPGSTRQLSVINGMKAICEDAGEISDADTVLIHDAARPFLTTALLDDCYKALTGHDGVMPVLPMKDTVYMSRDGKTVSSLLDRNEIFAGQAPELFLLKKYYRANTDLMPDRILAINGASEPAIMAGMDIVMIHGDEDNFKVTTNADLARFREITEA